MAQDHEPSRTDELDAPEVRSRVRRILAAALFAVGICAVVSAIMLAARPASSDAASALSAVWIRR